MARKKKIPPTKAEMVAKLIRRTRSQVVRSLGEAYDGFSDSLLESMLKGANLKLNINITWDVSADPAPAAAGTSEPPGA